MHTSRNLSAKSFLEYHRRLSPVLTWMQDSPEVPLSLEKASQLSCFSKFHFLRVFQALIGESFNEYKNRIRVERAATILLTHPKRRVTDVAMQLGYSSSENFTRAFKIRFGTPRVHCQTSPSLKKSKASSRHPILTCNV
ncbi:helix-turn-helix domain-containing protein [Enterovibrio nigricans]|uniref:Helix-turn-helix domain-containing protein n=1 Tax=Enterovibrio nigricans DSM 22720 TaxID=1121868 RepID=A0A1T4UC58_9GAMM|nr:AraC family transcriptional regulator [Enterovibrio nigricans]SKA50170.1 Helix-turn-helix domain-containing protein [Enterovibrio nigricans DSM 22720]